MVAVGTAGPWQRGKGRRCQRRPLHRDRGTAMISKPVAWLLADLGITKSHSRPIPPTTTPSPKPSTRPSSIDRISRPASAAWRMPGRSVAASSPGTTPGIATPASASSPPRWSTSAGLPINTPPIPNASSASAPSHQRRPPPPGSTRQPSWENRRLFTNIALAVSQTY